MPNFRAKKVKDLNFPFQKDGVEFLDFAKGRNLDLIYTKSLGNEFFLVLKNSGDKYIIKGEKATKPTKILHIQKALEVFRDEFCEDIISEAFNFKDKKEVKSCIYSENSLLEIFKNYEKIFIEIGFGSGRHLLYQAKNNPNALVVGIEIYKPAIEQVNNLAKNLDNVALINTDARVFLSMIESNLIDRIFLHFPVPWDDAPHRRVVSDEFVNECERVLKSGARFELRTDSKEYYEYSLSKFAKLKGKLQTYKNKDAGVSSKYEDRWRRQNKNIYDLFFTNSLNSTGLNDKFEFNFPRFDFEKIYENFANITEKFDGYFIHFEEIYRSKSGIYMRISLGAFDLPQQCYIRINGEISEYFIKKPLATKENFLAHQKIREIFEKWQR